MGCHFSSIHSKAKLFLCYFICHNSLVNEKGHRDQRHSEIGRFLSTQCSSVTNEQLCIWMLWKKNVCKETGNREKIVKHPVDILQFIKLPRILACGTHFRITTFLGTFFSTLSNFQITVCFSFPKASNKASIVPFANLSERTFVPRHSKITPCLAPSMILWRS